MMLLFLMTFINYKYKKARYLVKIVRAFKKNKIVIKYILKV